MTDDFAIQEIEVEGTTVSLLTSEDEMIELEFVKAAMELRRTNEQAFEVLWDLLDVLMRSPPALEA